MHFNCLLLVLKHLSLSVLWRSVFRSVHRGRASEQGIKSQTTLTSVKTFPFEMLSGKRSGSFPSYLKASHFNQKHQTFEPKGDFYHANK